MQTRVLRGWRVWVSQDFAKYVAGSHVLYFHIESTSIDVVRILHGSMDPKLHL